MNSKNRADRDSEPRGDPQAVGMSRRGRLALRRWFEVVGAGVVGTAVVLLVVHWFRDDYYSLVDVPTWTLAPATICLLALSYHLGRTRWGAFSGVRHLPSYPPLWVGSLLGTGVALLLLGTFSEIREGLPIAGESGRLLWLAGTLCVAVVVALGLASVFVLSRAPRRQLALRREETIHHSSQTFASFEKLVQWLAHDKAPTRSADDLFGHARIADRIAERLLEPRPPAQAVVGRLGAGKTTLRGLVVDALAKLGRERQVRVVPIELWPYETSRAAVEGVIRGLVEALAKEVNVVGLRGLSAAYAEAMSTAGGWWSALVRVQGVPASPLESLTAIDDIATAIGIRYVVWIEDLERFAGGDDSKEVEERLNPIRALHYGLDKLDSITVVTATTTLRMRFDIEKIARYVEELPKLAEPDAGKILALFRKGCLEGWDVIDPAVPAVREELNALGSDNAHNLLRALLPRSVYAVSDALPALCATPRALKQALRTCLDTWQRLPGEIDFDDVLILSIVRESQPSAFAIIQDHVHYLRDGHFARDEDRRSAKGASERLFGDSETIARLLAGEDPTNWSDSPLVQAVLAHLRKGRDHAC